MGGKQNTGRFSWNASTFKSVPDISHSQYTEFVLHVNSSDLATSLEKEGVEGFDEEYRYIPPGNPHSEQGCRFDVFIQKCFFQPIETGVEFLLIEKQCRERYNEGLALSKPQELPYSFERSKREKHMGLKPFIESQKLYVCIHDDLRAEPNFEYDENDNVIEGQGTGVDIFVRDAKFNSNLIAMAKQVVNQYDLDYCISFV